MENIKADNKIKFNPAVGAEHLFSSETVKIILYLALISTSFLILYFTAYAAMESYPNLYAIDAKMENEAETDVSSEMKIVFNQPVIFLNENNIEITPYLKLDFDLSGDGKILTLWHKEPLFFETKYEIELKEVRGLSGLLLDNKKFIIFTKSSGKEKEDPELKNREGIFSELQLSENKYIPPKISQPSIDVEFEPKFTQGKYIDVSIDYQIMTLFEDGIEANSFLISSGIPGLSTPLGTYSVQRKEINHWSGYGLWMPYSLNFSGPFYIHELPYWPGGYREGENHLGIKASHGCIRLGVGPAKYVYDWADIGTPVYVHK